MWGPPCVSAAPAQVRQIRKSIYARAEDRREFLSLSVDATLRCCMPVLGQASYRAPAEERRLAAFPDEDSWRRVLTVRGRTGHLLRQSLPTQVAWRDEHSLHERCSARRSGKGLRLGRDDSGDLQKEEQGLTCEHIDWSGGVINHVQPSRATSSIPAVQVRWSSWSLSAGRPPRRWPVPSERG